MFQLGNSKPSSDLWSNKCWASRVWKFGSKSRNSVKMMEKCRSIAAHHFKWKTCGVRPPKRNLRVFHKSSSCSPHPVSTSLLHPLIHHTPPIKVCSFVQRRINTVRSVEELPSLKQLRKKLFLWRHAAIHLKKQRNFLLRRFMGVWGHKKTGEHKNTTALGD